MKRIIATAILAVTSLSAAAGVGGWQYAGSDIYGTVYHYKNVENLGGGHIIFDLTARYKDGSNIVVVQETACRSGYSRQWVSGKLTAWELIPPNTLQESIALKMCK